MSSQTRKRVSFELGNESTTSSSTVINSTISDEDIEEALKALNDNHDYDLSNYTHTPILGPSLQAEASLFPIISPFPARGRPGFSSSSPGLIKFMIGSDVCTVVESFYVHMEHATFHSPVIRELFTAPYITGKIRTYALDDVEPDTFRLLVRWIYSDQNLELDTHFHKDSSGGLVYTGKSGHATESSFCIQTRKVVKLWVLAAELRIPRLQNQVMRYLYTLVDYPPWPLSKEAELVYSNTIRGCPLRKLLVHVGMNYVSSEEHEKSIKAGVQYPQEYLKELFVICHRRLGLSELPAPLQLKDLMVEVRWASS